MCYLIPQDNLGEESNLQEEEPGVYICITLLAIATQQNIQDVINEEFVDLLFAMKICPVLTVALKELAETVPSLTLKNYIRGGNVLKQLQISFPLVLILLQDCQKLCPMCSVSKHRNSHKFP